MKRKRMESGRLLRFASTGTGWFGVQRLEIQDLPYSLCLHRYHERWLKTSNHLLDGIRVHVLALGRALGRLN